MCKLQHVPLADDLTAYRGRAYAVVEPRLLAFQGCVIGQTTASTESSCKQNIRSFLEPW